MHSTNRACLHNTLLFHMTCTVRGPCQKAVPSTITNDIAVQLITIKFFCSQTSLMMKFLMMKQRKIAKVGLITNCSVPGSLWASKLLLVARSWLDGCNGVFPSFVFSAKRHNLGCITDKKIRGSYFFLFQPSIPRLLIKPRLQLSTCLCTIYVPYSTSAEGNVTLVGDVSVVCVSGIKLTSSPTVH